MTSTVAMQVVDEETEEAAVYEVSNDKLDGGDEPDSQLMLTVDSAGVQFSSTCEVRIHSCINIATQVEPTDTPCATSCWDSLIHMGASMIMKRLVIAAVVIAVVLVVVLLERWLGMEIMDEKKILQTLTEQLTPQLLRTTANTTSSGV